MITVLLLVVIPVIVLVQQWAEGMDMLLHAVIRVE